MLTRIISRQLNTSQPTKWFAAFGSASLDCHLFEAKHISGSGNVYTEPQHNLRCLRFYLA